MKILSANKFHYVFGGSDRYFFELNQLHEEAGHEVIPFAMKHPQNLPSPYDKYFVSQVNYWDDPGILDKVKAAGRIFYSGEANKNIRRLLHDHRPDIAHIHLIYHQISPSILPVLQSEGIPIIQTLHDYKPICPTYSLVAHGQICERCRGGRYYQATFQRCNHDSLLASGLNSAEMYLHHALGWYDIPDLFVTPSDFMRRKMMEFGMPGDKIVHVPNFVDHRQFQSASQSERYFIYLGRLHEIKGVHTLLEAFSLVNTRHIRLLLVGDGPQRPALEQRAGRLGLDNVEFCGYLTGAKLTEVLNGAMFNVLPSEVYENCPMSVLETMAMGIPTIGARIGGIPEIISDEEDGLLFNSGDAADLAARIDFMLHEPDLHRRLGDSARRKVAEQFDAHSHYQRMMALYEQIIP